MHLTTVMFDLDGTLLDYDLRDQFLPNYFAALETTFANRIKPERLVDGIQLASEAIGHNDGTNLKASDPQPTYRGQLNDVKSLLLAMAQPSNEVRRDDA
ncbi:MAG: hypothetical protein P1S60_18290 [Anaerolineae bacterium]|nr:hypothetical protein [Anaerolineae bacterium]